MPEVEVIGGPEKRRVILVDHDPAWALAFERQRRTISQVLLPLPHRVDHIGSTSVPGLVAKPIVDLQLSVPSVEDEDAYVPPLVRVGYALRVREPGHRMLRTGSLDVHLHVCDAGSDWERRHLLFRDWLRASPPDRERYALAKRELATQDWPTLNDYADAKSSVVAAIMARAEAWAAETGWTPGRPDVPL